MAGSHSAWQVVGAAVAGSAHLRLGIPCQDALAYRLLNGAQADGELPHGILLAALSDGAGSAQYADLGARLAVETALNSLVQAAQDPVAPDQDLAAPDENLSALAQDPAAWQDSLCRAFESARLALLELAETEQTPLREYAATLTCLVATPGGLAIGTLGDCLVVAGDVQGALFAANSLQRGEYANETNFLTQEDALSQVQVTLVKQPVAQLALLSDGLSRLALSLPAQAPYAPFFQPLFRFTAALDLEDEAAQPQAVEKLAAFLASERVCARTDDDKALLLAVWTGDSGVQPTTRMERSPAVDRTTQAGAAVYAAPDSSALEDEAPSSKADGNDLLVSGGAEAGALETGAPGNGAPDNVGAEAP